MCKKDISWSPRLSSYEAIQCYYCPPKTINKIIGPYIVNFRRKNRIQRLFISP